MPKILVQCGSCRGTGLYEGFAEPVGEPVICLSCGGSGGEYLSYTKYIGRRHRPGVKLVRKSRGTSVALGVGGLSNTEMSYQEFLDTVPEAKKED